MDFFSDSRVIYLLLLSIDCFVIPFAYSFCGELTLLIFCYVLMLYIWTDHEGKQYLSV